ncbi:hypothetical protein PA25_10350 [Pseudoalteromonas sp. A25]|uniref:fimbrial biogenesis chaperone n=1 Tax=Pseudoalteromonas sp. A25 TaxID=116092 RepID=UPI001260A25A|nr:fimbria/pilus periplasmic chaperone [Pseudoalteromonas sp. A25]BBN81050.1 hypothetical protein PA25_10350 [Pseudoalteromonas sp. A25]
MKNTFISCFTLTSLILLGVFYSFNVHANLLISPTRIVFDERTRTAKVFIVNNSNERKTYRLDWQEKRAKAQGGYIDLPELTDSSLSPMMRMSPSQLSLAPGERQVVKLAIRKPKDMKEQEYRSHLRFKALPNQKALSQKQLGININMIMSYSIPVMYRAKQTAPTVNIENVALEKPNTINIDMKKQGSYSSFGKFEAWFIPDNGDEPQRIAVQSNTSIYAELGEARVALTTIDELNFKQKGVIRVSYVGQQEYKGHTFDEHTVAVKL